MENKYKSKLIGRVHLDMKELKMIMKKFVTSGWDLIANPAKHA